MHCCTARAANALQIAGRGIDRDKLDKTPSRTSRRTASQAIECAGRTFYPSRGLPAIQEGIHGGAGKHHWTAIWQRLQPLALPCPDCVAVNAEPYRQFRDIKTAIGLNCVRLSPLPCHRAAFRLGRR